MQLHDALRSRAGKVFQRTEEAFDSAFGGAGNPLRHLGALGLFFLWILVATGLYLYTVLDTSVTGVYESIGDLSTPYWSFGGIVRSLHRYASDGFVIVMFLHLLREWAFRRYKGFRHFSWVTGVPLIWLAFISAIGGYWIVWDVTAQYSATTTTELLDWLPIFSEPAARNFLSPTALNDRFFTVLVFIHIGVPLMLLLALWAHVNRISHVDYLPSRPLMTGTTGVLLLLALTLPAISGAPADLAHVAAEVRLDWFVLFIHPLSEQLSAPVTWALLLGGTALLAALPYLRREPSAPVAVVDPPNCNGCSRCHVDCPYEAITMVPHPGKTAHQLALVDPALCASCGICAGSCPSSTPFRSQDTLVTGIDMPQQPLDRLRQQLVDGLERLRGTTPVVVFGCDHAAPAESLAGEDTLALSLLCVGMLPPSFVEYALRSGADGVVVTGCRDSGCAFRLGTGFTRERLLHRREPHLRDSVPRDRLLIHFASSADGPDLRRAVADFRHRLAVAPASPRPPSFRRRKPHNA